MTDRGTLPEALIALGWEPASAERQDCTLGGFHVVNPGVEVEPVWIPGSGQRGGIHVDARRNGWSRFLDVPGAEAPMRR